MRGGVDGGQVDGEDGAFAEFGVDVDEAFMAFDDGDDGGEAEAGAFVDVLGGEEGLEDFVEHIGGNADAGVGDVDFDVASRFGADVERGVLLVDHAVSDADDEVASVGHGVARVDAEVEEHLVHLGGVAHDGPDVVGDDEFQSDVLGEGVLDDVLECP